MMLQNPEFLLILPLTLIAAKVALHSTGYSTKLGVSRVLIISLLVLAAASPAITQIEQASTQQKLNILKDNTTSTQLLEPAQLPEGSETVFASGNSSQIFAQAAQNIEQGSYNVLVTDGQGSGGVQQLIDTAQQKNSTVSVYRSETREEYAVSIEGPSTTVPGAENSFTVDIDSTREKPVPANITLDGEVVFSGEINGSYTFQRTFDSQGEHTLQAHILRDDAFQRNNHFYRTVEVREKPEILSIGERGALERNLEQFYDIENRESTPQDLSSYYTVLMKKPLESQRLKTYLANGNGLMYTGPMRENIPSYLPVRAARDEEGDTGARVIILIDASIGTGSCKGGYTTDSGTTICDEATIEGGAAKESLQIAYSLVDSLERNNEVGVVAYNDHSYLVSEPKSLAYSREQIKGKIAKISPSGPSFHDLGVRGAARLAEENDTVVMLSDGNIGHYAREDIAFKTRSEAAAMEAKLITVGMGEDPNEPLLEDIADTAGGYYLENTEAGRLEFRFGSGGGGTEYKAIKVVNPQHFITEGLELDGSTTGFKPVDTRSSASKLVAGVNGEDFLSTWRYGLGRVAAFSGGQENLDRTVESDPGLVSRTVAWTVGNPQRKEDRWLNVQDAARPEDPEAKASYSVDGLIQQSKDLYTSEIPAPSIGLREWRNESYAYNYNPEIGDVGLNEDNLQEIAQATGGSVFDASDTDRITQQVSSMEKKVTERVSLAPFLIAAALLVFLAEVGYRKMNSRL